MTLRTIAATIGAVRTSPELTTHRCSSTSPHARQAARRLAETPIALTCPTTSRSASHASTRSKACSTPVDWGWAFDVDRARRMPLAHEHRDPLWDDAIRRGLALDRLRPGSASPPLPMERRSHRLTPDEAGLYDDLVGDAAVRRRLEHVGIDWARAGQRLPDRSRSAQCWPQREGVQGACACPSHRIGLQIPPGVRDRPRADALPRARCRHQRAAVDRGRLQPVLRRAGDQLGDRGSRVPSNSWDTRPSAPSPNDEGPKSIVAVRGRA